MTYPQENLVNNSIEGNLNAGRTEELANMDKI
jgi:hypothetical protein